MDIVHLLHLVPQMKASDMHLHAGGAPTVRIDGDITPVPQAPVLSREDVRRLIYDMLTDQQKARFEAEMNLDLAVELEGAGRFRLNVFMDRNGPAASFRLIPEQILSLEELDMPPVMRSFAEYESGLVLVTGPTGSGKSTTLAAMVDLINRERRKRIITIEDPIEFVHEHRSSTVNQREVGPHTPSFANALKAALREDPDVILVGELRDLETISLAITAAETGHLVLSTLHTPGAPQAIDRVIDVFPLSQQEQIRSEIAESLRGVAWQVLLPQAIGHGRVPAVEVLVATPSIRNLIRENKTYQMYSIMETGARDGMRTMDQALADLAMKSRITMATAEQHMRHPGSRRDLPGGTAGRRSAASRASALPSRPGSVKEW